MNHLVNFSSSSSFHVTQLSSSDGARGGNGTVGPLFVVLAIIMILGAVAGFISRICAGRHWGGDTQYDFEGWVEKRCASCIDGDIEAPPPPPPPPEKPPEAAAPPPAEAPAPAADAPPADGAPPADAPPPPADAAAPAPAPAQEGEAAAAPPAEAPPAEAPPAEAAPPPPSEPQPPPPPPPPPPEETGERPPAAYAGSRVEPLTYMQLYPSYSCRCHICAREGIFE